MKKNNNVKIIYTFLFVVLAGFLLFVSYSRVFDEFENSTFDLRYKLRPPREALKEIVIVEIGDDSIEKLGKWPFPRNYHALLLKALESAGAKAVMCDIFFSEPKEEDEELAKAAQETGMAYMPYVFEFDMKNPDKRVLHAAGYAASLLEIFEKSVKGTGFINVVPDMDGKVRRIPAFIEYQGKYYPHLTLLIALNRMGYDFNALEIVPEKGIMDKGKVIVPLEEGSSVLVNYPDVWGKAFRHYSYVDIVQSYLADMTGQEPTLDLSVFKDTVCFVGLTATAAPDAHPSPMEALYPGIGVHTSLYNSILKNDYLTRLNRYWNMLILLFMWFLTAVLTARSHRRFGLICILLITFIFTVAATAVFWAYGVWVDIFYPLVTIAAVYVIFTFRKYVSEMQRREIMEKELSIADEIQQSFLPKTIVTPDGVDIAVKMITARQVGGDLYDIIKIDDKTLGVMIGDVSGKGVPAALFMARAVSLFKIYAGETDLTTADVIKKLNDRLASESGSSLFVTVAYSIIDMEKRKISYAIGGHMPTVMVSPDGTVDLLDVEMGMPLGMLECDFSLGEREYKPGTIFIFYTDGVTEAMNTKGEMFGQDRLVELAKKIKDLPMTGVIEAIQKAVSDFEGKAEQHDDITVMAVRV